MPAKPAPPAELNLTCSWWDVISGEQGNKELVDHLEDTGKRETELAALHDDLDALPPWLEVRQETARHAAEMDTRYSASQDWLASLHADEVALAGLNDRQFCQVLAEREKQPEPVSREG